MCFQRLNAYISDTSPLRISITNTTSNSCLKTKQKFIQTASGLAAGLQLVLWTGYPGFGMEYFYLGLDKKPSWFVLIDHPSVNYPGNTGVQAGIKNGMRTSISLRSKKRIGVPAPVGNCDMVNR